jgi:Dyp-type peroxidase family
MVKPPPPPAQDALDKSDVQGIVGSGYAHLDYMAYFFLHIDDAADARAWLTDFIPRIQTSADWPRADNGEKIKPQVTWNMAWTFKGLQQMKISPTLEKTFSRQFIEGMSVEYRVKDVLSDIDDSAPEHWTIGGPASVDENTIHIMLILYTQNETGDNSRDEQTAWLEDSLGNYDGLRIVQQETGFRDGEGHEPFGFKDGISNPQIEGIHTPLNDTANDNCVRTGEFLLGYYNEYQQYPATPITQDDPQDVLPAINHPDLSDYKDFGKNGTYIVYRKLMQRVGLFWNFVQEQCTDDNGNVDEGEMRLLASKFFGRWPSGAPLTLSPDRDDPEKANDLDFRYMEKDAHGYRCPFTSHIRRANPRDSFVEDDPELSIRNSKLHRIMRRASIYGNHLVTDEMTLNGNVPVDLEDDETGRGIHFFSVNADIHRQFEFVQQVWCNNPHFNHIYNSRDPIIGPHQGTLRGSGHVEHVQQDYVTIEKQPLRDRVMDFKRFVETRGGEYFFMPSITALHYLTTLE